MSIKIKIGRCLIQEVLDSRGMTRQQLSDLTGKPESQISDYITRKKRKSMSLKNAKVFAKALKCNIDDLYEWEDI